jgi:hypothetical protein
VGAAELHAPQLAHAALKGLGGGECCAGHDAKRQINVSVQDEDGASRDNVALQESAAKLNCITAPHREGDAPRAEFEIDRAHR